MPVRQFIPLMLCLSIAPSLWAADPVDPPAGRTPLPHPEILQPSSSSPQKVQPPAALPEPSAQRAVEPAQVSAGAPAQIHEDKEIVPRSGRKTTVSATGQQTGDLSHRAGSGGWSLMRDMWPLLAVLLLIGGMGVIVKKYLPARRLLGGSEALKIVARTHVSPKQQLVLIKLGRRLVLLGVSPDRISSLSTVEDPDQVALMLGEIASRQPGSMVGAFASSMQDERETYTDEPAELDETEVTRGQVRGLLRKVRAMTGKGAGA